MSKMPLWEPGANRRDPRNPNLGDQGSRFFLRSFPNLPVRMADEPFIMQGMNVVAEILQQGCKPERKILVQLDIDRMCGTAGTGKSSSAEAAANAMAAQR